MTGGRYGAWDGDRYQAKFDALAAAGENVHGEVDFVMRLGPGSVLDAGCGSGRVACELAARGVDVVGVDVDESMLATARARDPGLCWVVADLCALDLAREFDAVVLAGNVPLFATLGTQGELVAGCARHVAAGGALVAGFQLGRGYALSEYDAACGAAGLQLVERWATWGRAPFADGAVYAVSVHRFGLG